MDTAPFLLPPGEGHSGLQVPNPHMGSCKKKACAFHRLPFHREERGAPGIRPEATQNFSGQASVTHLTKGREEKLFLLKSLYFIID